MSNVLSNAAASKGAGWAKNVGSEGSNIVRLRMSSVQRVCSVSLPATVRFVVVAVVVFLVAIMMSFRGL